MPYFITGLGYIKCNDPRLRCEVQKMSAKNVYQTLENPPWNSVVEIHTVCHNKFLVFQVT